MSILAESIVSNTIGKIGDLAIQGVFLHGVRGEIDYINLELQVMLAFLRDAAAKGKRGDEVAKTWVLQVQEAACDAEDAVEMYCLRIEMKRRRRKKLPKKFIYFFMDLYHLRKIGTKIKEVKTRISEIHYRRSAYNVTEIGTGEGEGQSSPRSKLLEYRKIAAVAEDDEVVGFENDANTLATRLTTGDEDCRVVAIVAMGGAGKTTLANKVYRRRDVRDHFGGCVAWVCVSQSYNVKELLKEIAAQVKMSQQEFEQLNVRALQQRLREFLLGQRYLIVLDDIWENDAWDQLEAAFPSGRNGSRIMMTTRSKDVASRVDRKPYELLPLTEDESWILFRKKAFLSENGAMSCPEELGKIGKQIVAKCSGLPLAIKVMGGLIAVKNRMGDSSLSVLNGLPPQLSEDEVRFSDMLALSYEDLPHYLKPCFLYFGLFPEDQDISAKKLIRLWVAEGFIERRGQETLEDVAEEYLEALISRSMIQAERRYDRSVRTCRIHGLLHEVAIREGRQNRFFEIDRNLNDSTSTTVRRLAIHDKADCYDWLGCSVLNLRSFLCFTKANAFKFPTGAAEFLKVLDLEFALVPADGLFDAMGGLNHLKYLSLNIYEVRRIPPSIAKLYKLETLLFHYNCRNVWDSLYPPDFHADISEEIWTMSQLRHLVAPACKLEGRPRFRHMKNLHTLFLTADNWMEDEEDSLSQSSSLRILKVDGDLNLDKRMLWNSIVQLVKIQSLVLKSNQELSTNEFLLPPTMPLKEHLLLQKMILKGRLLKLLHINEFPPNLTKLTLEDSLLEEDPMPTLEKLQNLQKLKLRQVAYMGRSMITSSQGFPQLRYLELSGLPQLKVWTMEIGAMRMLEFLYIRACPNLRMLPHGLRDMPRIREFVTLGLPENE